MRGALKWKKCPEQFAFLSWLSLARKTSCQQRATKEGNAIRRVCPQISWRWVRQATEAASNAAQLTAFPAGRNQRIVSIIRPQSQYNLPTVHPPDALPGFSGQVPADAG